MDYYGLTERDSLEDLPAAPREGAAQADARSENWRKHSSRFLLAMLDERE